MHDPSTERRTTDGASAQVPGHARRPIDGSGAVVEMETAGQRGGGRLPDHAVHADGRGLGRGGGGRASTNVNGRRLLFFEPEGEHAAAAVTAGMSMIGLRATNFSSGQGIAYMHESLYAAVGKRLTYVLNMACRAMTKHALNVHAGHDDYHAVDDTGFFQLFAKDVQEAADLNLIAHRIAELSLNPGVCAQDGFLTSHVIESMRLPERELVREYLGDPADIIDSPTPAQRLVFGEKRRRIPEMFDLDYPAMLGVGPEPGQLRAGRRGAAAVLLRPRRRARPTRPSTEYAALTGRRYARAMGYRLDDAEYVIVGQGSVVSNAEAVADHLRETRGLKVGVLNVTMFRPFPADLITHLLQGKKGVTVLERVDQPLAVDPPLLREIRAAMGKALENGRAPAATPPAPGLAACRPEDVPDFYSGCFGLGSRDLQPGDLVAAVENMLAGGTRRRQFYLGIDFVRKGTRLPKLQIWQEKLLEAYPHLARPRARARRRTSTCCPRARPRSASTPWAAGAPSPWARTWRMTAAELLGLYIKANPKYGSEKKGQPTTFYATLAHEPIRLNCELQARERGALARPERVPPLEPARRAARRTACSSSRATGGAEDALELAAAGARSATSASGSIRSVHARRVRDRAGRGVATPSCATACRARRSWARSSASSPLHGARRAGRGARCSRASRAQLEKKFGHLGERVVEDNLRVIRRGFDEVRAAGSRRRSTARRRGGGGRAAHARRARRQSRAQPGHRQPGPVLGAGLPPLQDGRGRHRRSVRGDQRHSGGDQHRSAT